MKSIFLNMRSKYSEMGPGERKIADLLISDPSSILPLSITVLLRVPVFLISSPP